MAKEPTRNPIKRVAVLLELEDGTTRALYSVPDPRNNDAEVNVETSRPSTSRFTDPEWTDVRVTIKGLRQFAVAERMPATVLAALDLIREVAGQ